MGKLVRDRIPDLVRAEGREPDSRLLTGDEYTAALLAKVVEEAEELRDATTVEDRLAEAADVYEVLLTVAQLCGASMADVIRLADVKRQQRGGFHGRVWLE